MIVDAKYIYKRFRYVKRKMIPIGLCCNILSSILKLMTDDAIHKNTYIEIPMFWGSAMLFIRKIHGREFVERYKNGEFHDVDYIMSDYCAYRLSIKNNSFDDITEVELDEETTNEITRITNSGHIY